MLSEITCYKTRGTCFSPEGMDYPQQRGDVTNVYWQ